jgi:hypothetical protein
MTPHWPCTQASGPPAHVRPRAPLRACARPGPASRVDGLVRGRVTAQRPDPGQAPAGAMLLCRSTRGAQQPGPRRGRPDTGKRLDLTCCAESGVDQRRCMTGQAGRLARTVPAGLAPARHPTVEVHDCDYCPRKPGTRPGRAGPASEVPGDPAGPGRPVTGVPGFPHDAEDDDDVDVLYLAGQCPAAPGEWLLITAVGAMPGAEFTARVLPDGGPSAHGGDVLVHLAAEPPGHLEPLTVRAGVWAVISGHLIPVAEWNRQGPEGWPEKIRTTVAFAMGMLTELEEHGADLAAGRRVDLDDAVLTATAGIPADVTLGLAGTGRPPVR